MNRYVFPLGYAGYHHIPRFPVVFGTTGNHTIPSATSTSASQAMNTQARHFTSSAEMMNEMTGGSCSDSARLSYRSNPNSSEYGLHYTSLTSRIPPPSLNGGGGGGGLSCTRRAAHITTLSSICCLVNGVRTYASDSGNGTANVNSEDNHQNQSSTHQAHSFEAEDPAAENEKPGVTEDSNETTAASHSHHHIKNNVDNVDVDNVSSSVLEAEVLAEVIDLSKQPPLQRDEDEEEDKDGTLDLRRIRRDSVHTLNEAESVRVEIHKLQYEFSQEGPYIGSKKRDAEVSEVDTRRRRAIVRVPQPEVEYRPNETSFRRLPKDAIMPNEYELRALYPQSTGLALVEGDADCVDNSAFGVDDDPMPMHYSMIVPPGWTKEKEAPFLVVIPDHRGIPRDFEDVCANFFERPIHRDLMWEQGWVVICPIINIRHNFQIPVEGVVARFCDWVVENFNVEHNKVHLFGKGNGGYVALRTVLEHKDVVISVTALLGRSGTPFRPMDRAQDKVKNFNGVHSLVFVPGLLRKQDWYYKFKFMMDMGRIRPALRNVHFADVRDHQVYYAVNPYEFWNYMRYFRQYNIKMLTESGYTIH